MNEIMCPHCYHEFSVEDFESGDCPSCEKMRYYWDDAWDYNSEETIGWSDFVWEPI